MRRTIFVISILIVFSSVARLVWVESEILAEAYEIQKLRRMDGLNRNEIRRLDVEIAKTMSQRRMEELAAELGFIYAAPRLLPRRDESIQRARH